MHNLESYWVDTDVYEITKINNAWYIVLYCTNNDFLRAIKTHQWSTEGQNTITNSHKYEFFINLLFKAFLKHRKNNKIKILKIFKKNNVLKRLEK